MSPARRRLTRKQVYRRRRIAVLGLIVVVLAFGSYVPAAATAAVPAAAPDIAAPAIVPTTAAVPDFPDYGRGAIGAIGFDGLLAASGDQGRFPIASITKIVTALLVLEAKPLAEGEAGPDIEFTEDDVDIYYDVLAEGGSLQPVSVGLVLSERQALETMLIPSANNYAESLARWAYGSQDAYLAAARVWLDAHGLTDTVVVDANGLSPQNESTPPNLVALGMLALANPVLASIVRMPVAEEPGIGEIDNTNKLLGTGGVDGIKTGTTDEAGACLLFSTDVTVGSQSIPVVGVILGAPDHDVLDEGVLALLASVGTGFQEVTLATAGTVYATYTTEWGGSAQAVAESTQTIVTWSDTPVAGSVSAPSLADGVAGDPAGSVTYTVGAQTYEIPLVLGDPIEQPDLWWRLTTPPWSR